MSCFKHVYQRKMDKEIAHSIARKIVNLQKTALMTDIPVQIVFLDGVDHTVIKVTDGIDFIQRR